MSLEIVAARSMFLMPREINVTVPLFRGQSWVMLGLVAPIAMVLELCGVDEPILG